MNDSELFLSTNNSTKVCSHLPDDADENSDRLTNFTHSRNIFDNATNGETFGQSSCRVNEEAVLTSYLESSQSKNCHSSDTDQSFASDVPIEFQVLQDVILPAENGHLANSCHFSKESGNLSSVSNALLEKSLSVAAVGSSSNDDDDLLAELENEFSLNADGSAQSSCHRLNSQNDVSSNELSLLQRRNTALQCRLDSTLENRKQLELETIRLEQKLMAANSSLESASIDVEFLRAELERQIEQNEKDMDAMSERLKQKDEDCQLVVEKLRIDYQLQLDQLTRARDDQQHEKDGAVVRFAQAEQRNLELNDRLQRAEMKIRDWTKERDVALGKWKAMKEDKIKLTEACEAKTSELTSLRKEMEKLKDSVSSADIKIKWHQNKLKGEQDTLKEYKLKHETTEKTVKNMSKEVQLAWEQIRAFYVVIQTYDNGSSSNHSRIDECKAASPEEVCSSMRKDFGMLSQKMTEVLEELRTFKDKVRCLEVERLSQENVLGTFRDSLECQQTSNSDLRGRISQLEHTESHLFDVSAKYAEATEQIVELKKRTDELEAEIGKLYLREAEQLEYTSRLSERNSFLQAENSRLETQVTTLTDELKSLAEHRICLEENHRCLEADYNNTKQALSDLERRHAEHLLSVESVKQHAADLEDEMKTLKRRHANNIKDLLRQLQQANRRVTIENGSTATGRHDCVSLGSLGSHGGSCGSLDTAGIELTTLHRVSKTPDSPPSVKNIQAANDMDPASMSELQALRRMLTRRNEKIEFLKDHVEQLLEELHRKSNIVRGYVMRDEAGTLVPESWDRNKLQLSKKGGIMASLYSTQTMDTGMTMGLSLEINNKLQALLEDALLKNITLKEGMDTLGKEIEWLKRENLRLTRYSSQSIAAREELTTSLREDHS